MADSSTAIWPILVLSLEHHWARHRLHAGIMYVSDAPISMKSLTTLQGRGSLELGTLVIPELNRKFLHNRLVNVESVTWTSSFLRPATHRYKVHLCYFNTLGDRPPF